MNDIYTLLKKQADSAGGPYTETIINTLADTTGKTPHEVRDALQILQNKGKLTCQVTRIDRQKFDRKFFVKILS